MRYTKEHKQETRQRIVETAARRLKRDGIDASGVATLMKDAGLTGEPPAASGRTTHPTTQPHARSTGRTALRRLTDNR